MIDALLQIAIKYDPVRLTGRLERRGASTSSAWDRIRSRAISDQADATLTDTTIELSWPKLLGILRDFGGRAQQQALGFRFVPEGEAGDRVRQFSEEVHKARAARNTLTLQVTREQIEEQLHNKGFTRRALKRFQLRDLERLLSLPHGANFSVPGAGKTTVTFALHLLTRRPGQHLLVISPKTAFPAWREVISDCMDPAAPDGNAEPFVMLEGGPDEIDRLLRSGATRFLMTYDLMVRQTDLLAGYLARQPVHLVLDEAHRMKAGLGSLRGSFLINVAALPARRDILTGTPMPQGPGDIWPLNLPFYGRDRDLISKSVAASPLGTFWGSCMFAPLNRNWRFHGRIDISGRSKWRPANRRSMGSCAVNRYVSSHRQFEVAIAGKSTTCARGARLCGCCSFRPTQSLLCMAWQRVS